jgi:hypothetical protein
MQTGGTLPQADTECDSKRLLLPSNILTTHNLHFHPEAPQEAEVFLGKESHGKARLVDTAINNRVGRSWAKQSDPKDLPKIQDSQAPKVKGGELFNRQQLHGELL